MNDQQIDGVFERAPEMPSALAAQIRARIQADTLPVKPMLSGNLYALLFTAFASVMSVAFATLLKWKGLHALSAEAAAELLLVLLITAFLGANAAARSMRPASGRLHSWLIGGLALLGYEALVFRLFNDYATDAFVHSGLLCLSLGLLCGVFVAAPLWLIVRRGFVVQPVRSGAAIGLTGGLSGLAFLTLHCAILTVPHTGVWHVGVLVVCMAAGALAGKCLNRTSHR